MRELLIQQEDLVQCDNITCDYKVPNPTKNPNTDLKPYVNMPCPKCGENLLTEKDYNKHKKVIKVVAFINKYFSWII